ncbi:MAG TPA: hypothetical protein VGL96_12940, partial [Casimicrobiaceae bacterium]
PCPYGSRSLDVGHESLPRSGGRTTTSRLLDARAQPRCVGGHRVARTLEELLGVHEQRHTQK